MKGDGDLGRAFEDGELILRQGDRGDFLYVIQEGHVEIFREEDGEERPLRTAGPGEVIGEMALFGNEERSATVRARGPARLLTVDRKNFLSRVHRDPSLAVKILELQARRIRELSSRVAELEAP